MRRFFPSWSPVVAIHQNPVAITGFEIKPVDSVVKELAIDDQALPRSYTNAGPTVTSMTMVSGDLVGQASPVSIVLHAKSRKPRRTMMKADSYNSSSYRRPDTFLESGPYSERKGSSAPRKPSGSSTCGMWPMPGRTTLRAFTMLLCSNSSPSRSRSISP